MPENASSGVDVVAGSRVEVLVGDGSGTLVGAAVAGIFVCVGSKVLTDDLVLTTTGVWVGRGVDVTDLSAVSATVSALDGAQEANTKATTKPHNRNHIVLI